jgi:hypothetical protein
MDKRKRRAEELDRAEPQNVTARLLVLQAGTGSNGFASVAASLFGTRPSTPATAERVAAAERLRSVLSAVEGVYLGGADPSGKNTGGTSWLGVASSIRRRWDGSIHGRFALHVERAVVSDRPQRHDRLDLRPMSWGAQTGLVFPGDVLIAGHDYGRVVASNAPLKRRLQQQEAVVVNKKQLGAFLARIGLDAATGVIESGSFRADAGFRLQHSGGCLVFAASALASEDSERCAFAPLEQATSAQVTMGLVQGMVRRRLLQEIPVLERTLGQRVAAALGEDELTDGLRARVRDALKRTADEDLTLADGEILRSLDLGRVDARLEGRLATFRLSGEGPTITIDPSAQDFLDNLGGGSAMLLIRTAARLDGSARWQASIALKRARADGGVDIMGSLGEAILDSEGLVFTDGVGHAVEVGSGLGLYGGRVSWADDGLHIASGTLRASRPIGDLSEVAVTCAWNDGDVSCALDGPSESRLVVAVESVLRTQGLLPQGVHVGGITIDKRGLRVVLKGDISAELKDALQTLTDPIGSDWLESLGRDRKAALEQYRDLAARSYERLVDDATAVANLLSQGLRRPQPLPRASSHRLGPATLKVDCPEDPALRCSLDVLADPPPAPACEPMVRLKGDAVTGLITSQVSERCVGEITKRYAPEAIGVGSVKAEWMADGRKVRVSGDATVGGVTVPLDFSIGLDGAIRWNYEALAQATAAAVRAELEKKAEGLADAAGALAERNAAVAKLKAAVDQFLSKVNCRRLGDVELQPGPSGLPEEVVFSLVCTVPGTSDPGKAITLRNVHLNRTGLDLSHAAVDDGGLRDALVAALPHLPRLGGLEITPRPVQVERKSLTLPFAASLAIPPLEMRVPVEMSVTLDESGVRLTSAVGGLAAAVEAAINGKLLPRDLDVGGTTCHLEKASRGGSFVVLSGWSRVSSDPEIRIPFDIRVGLEEPGSVTVDVGLDGLKSQLLGEGLRLLTQFGLDKLPKDATWLRGVRAIDADGRDLDPVRASVPAGLRLHVAIDVIPDQVTIETRDLRVTTRGVFLGEDFLIRVPGRITVPPLCFSELGGRLGTKIIEVSASAAVVECETRRLLKLQGTFGLDPSKPLVWHGVTNLRALDFLELSKAETTIDFEGWRYKSTIGTQGPLADLVSLKGNADVRLRSDEQRLQFDGRVEFLKAQDLSILVSGALDQNGLAAAGDVTLLGVTAEAKLVVSANPFDIRLHASANGPEIAGVRIANLAIEIGSDGAAKVEATALGFRVTLPLPSFSNAGLHEILEAWIKRLLNKNWADAPKALVESILKGSVTINPFENFGSGGGGDGGGSGSAPGINAPASVPAGMPSGMAQSSGAAGPGATNPSPTSAVSPGVGPAEQPGAPGGSPAPSPGGAASPAPLDLSHASLLPPGSYSYGCRCGIDSGHIVEFDPKQNARQLAYVSSRVSGVEQWKAVSPQLAVTRGIELDIGDDYYVHALPDGQAYVFTGRTASDGRNVSFALQDLGVTYETLSQGGSAPISKVLRSVSGHVARQISAGAKEGNGERITISAALIEASASEATICTSDDRRPAGWNRAYHCTYAREGRSEPLADYWGLLVRGTIPGETTKPFLRTLVKTSAAWPNRPNGVSVFFGSTDGIVVADLFGAQQSYLWSRGSLRDLAAPRPDSLRRLWDGNPQAANRLTGALGEWESAGSEILAAGAKGYVLWDSRTKAIRKADIAGCPTAGVVSSDALKQRIRAWLVEVPAYAGPCVEPQAVDVDKCVRHIAEIAVDEAGEADVFPFAGFRTDPSWLLCGHRP